MKFYLASHITDNSGTRSYTPVSLEINPGDKFRLVTYARYSDPEKPRGLVETGSRVYSVGVVRPGYFEMSSPASGANRYEQIRVFEGESGNRMAGEMWLGAIYWRMKRV